MRIRRKRKFNPTMLELLAGILVYGIVMFALILLLYFLSVPLENWFNDSIVQIVIGYVIGIIFSVITIFHMTSSVEKAIEMGENGALKHTRLMYIVRMIALMVVIALMIIFNFGNIFSLLFGLLSLKVAAYIQPITHRLLTKGR